MPPKKRGSSGKRGRPRTNTIPEMSYHLEEELDMEPSASPSQVTDTSVVNNRGGRTGNNTRGRKCKYQDADSEDVGNYDEVDSVGTLDTVDTLSEEPTTPGDYSNDTDPEATKAENLVRSPCMLDVICGDLTGVMSLKKLHSGSKGPCILFNDCWLTPNEFQYVSGRESAKDWKRSIRHGAKSLKLLLSTGHLSFRKRMCRCGICVGNDGDQTNSVSQNEASKQDDGLEDFGDSLSEPGSNSPHSSLQNSPSMAFDEEDVDNLDDLESQSSHSRPLDDASECGAETDSDVSSQSANRHPQCKGTAEMFTRHQTSLIDNDGLLHKHISNETYENIYGNISKMDKGDDRVVDPVNLQSSSKDSLGKESGLVFDKKDFLDSNENGVGVKSAWHGSEFSSMSNSPDPVFNTLNDVIVPRKRGRPPKKKRIFHGKRKRKADEVNDNVSTVEKKMKDNIENKQLLRISGVSSSVDALDNGNQFKIEGDHKIDLVKQDGTEIDAINKICNSQPDQTVVCSINSKDKIGPGTHLSHHEEYLDNGSCSNTMKADPSEEERISNIQVDNYPRKSDMKGACQSPYPDDRTSQSHQTNAGDHSSQRHMSTDSLGINGKDSCCKADKVLKSYVLHSEEHINLSTYDLLKGQNTSEIQPANTSQSDTANPMPANSKEVTATMTGTHFELNQSVHNSSVTSMSNIPCMNKQQGSVSSEGSTGKASSYCADEPDEQIPSTSGTDKVNVKSSGKKVSRLMNIIDGIRITKQANDPLQNSNQSSSKDNFHQRKCRKHVAPRQYLSMSEQYEDDDEEDEDGEDSIGSDLVHHSKPNICVPNRAPRNIINNRVPTIISPLGASTSPAPKASSSPGIYSSKPSSSSSLICPASTLLNESRDLAEAEKDLGGISGHLPFGFPPPPMMNLPHTLFTSMMQTGLPLEWQLALMNRQLGASELAYLTQQLGNSDLPYFPGAMSSLPLPPPTSLHKDEKHGMNLSLPFPPGLPGLDHFLSMSNGQREQTRESKRDVAELRHHREHSHKPDFGLHISQSQVHPAFGHASPSGFGIYQQALSQHASRAVAAQQSNITLPPMASHALSQHASQARSMASTKHEEKIHSRRSRRSGAGPSVGSWGSLKAGQPPKELVELSQHSPTLVESMHLYQPPAPALPPASSSHSRPRSKPSGSGAGQPLDLSFRK